MSDAAIAQDLAALAAQLQTLAGLQGKRDIQAAAASLPHRPFPKLGLAAALGDDAALLPATANRLLFACEGIHPDLVAEDPWFAGWSGVLVNLSDIAAMGGRPIAVVNSLWSRDRQHADQVFAGLQFAAEKFGIPIVGGHSNLQSPYSALSVAVLGQVGPHVLSARSAQAGDRCYLLINRDGQFYRHYPFWDAATGTAPEQLRRHWELMAQLADAGLVSAAKDVSMGGLIGTAVMFAETSGAGLDLQLDRLSYPAGVSRDRWLTCFPSFGFLLAVPEACCDRFLQRVATEPDLTCDHLGSFTNTGQVRLCDRQAQVCFWDCQEQSLMGFSALTDPESPH